MKSIAVYWKTYYHWQSVESAHDVRVVIYEMDLLILVRNLVDNAIRYTPLDGRIDLSIERVQGAAILRVRDSGPGINAAEQARVFDPFYRSLGTDEAGSGLGLSIVKAIADRTGADVQLGYSDDIKQSGLCVSVWLTPASLGPPAQG